MKPLENKYHNIGKPYRVKTKLPFYDNRGVYQGTKVPYVGGSTAGQSRYKKDLHMQEEDMRL